MNRIINDKQAICIRFVLEEVYGVSKKQSLRVIKDVEKIFA
jgi:hypothetical protein